ncbi:MAG: radical SAM protein [Thermodesulfobacteriota bacterium]
MTRPREQGAVRKQPGASLPVALVYPNVYRVGMGNLGFQRLYHYLNSHPRFSAQRFFLPETAARRGGAISRLVSEEHARPLSYFPVVAFSVPFENDYPTIPAMLSAGGIPPLQTNRRPSDPLVVAGGVSVSINPEPLAAFMDLIFIGEIEDEPERVETGFFDRIAEFQLRRRGRPTDRSAILREFRDQPAVYVPSAYRFTFADSGLIHAIDPERGFPRAVRAAKRRSKSAPVPVSVLFSPEVEFGESLLVETNRGCGRGCRFCAAGWIHFPVRYAAFDRFRMEAEKAVAEGRSVGLIGSDLAGHPELESILTWIVGRGGTFSLSSIRPEGLSPRIIELLAKTGQQTATLAPEVASRRLKKVIGKEIPSERFYELVDKLVATGIPNIRFYFMIGLPTETDDDVHQIVDFVMQSRKIFVGASRPRGKIGKMGIQINPFVPKAWTPFQWAGMADSRVLELRIAMLKKALGKMPNVVLRVESAREALHQAVLSRGDRRIAAAILRVATQQGRWSGVFKQEKLGPDFYAQRERDREEIFPWDVVDHGVSKKRLREIYLKSLSSGRS